MNHLSLLLHCLIILMFCIISTYKPGQESRAFRMVNPNGSKLKQTPNPHRINRRAHPSVALILRSPSAHQKGDHHLYNQNNNSTQNAKGMNSICEEFGRDEENVTLPELRNMLSGMKLPE
jgi:hypothetical protein